MSLPDLSQLRTTELGAPPTKRAASGDGGAKRAARGSGKQNELWQNWVLRDTWSGVPGGFGNGITTETLEAYGGEKQKVLDAAYSPNGDWSQRYVKPTSWKAVLVEGPVFGGGKPSCKVVPNEWTFEPQGKHYLPAEMVRKGLRAHYNETDTDKIMETIPPPDATATHLRRWVRTLPEPSWYDETKKDRPAAPPKTEYARVLIEGNTWVGPVDTEGRPHGVGTMFFVAGDSYRGLYRRGKRWYNTFGTRTFANGSSETGMYLSDGEWKTSQEVAEYELGQQQKRVMSLPDAQQYRENMLVQKPGMGPIVPGAGQVLLRRATSDVHESIVDFFAGSNPAQLNSGRDSLLYTRDEFAYSKILPVATFDVDYSRSGIQREWERVQNSFLRQFSKCTAQPLRVRTDKAFSNEDGSGITSQGVHLDDRTGEKYLVHGSSAMAIESILNSSFDIKRARPGWYGKAVYFADDPSKSDQYAKSDGGVRSSDLLDRLGIKSSDWDTKAVVSREGKREVFFMFVTRVALGCTAQLTKEVFDRNEQPTPKDPSGSAPPPLPKKLFEDADFPPKPLQMSRVTTLREPYNSVAVDAYAQGNKNMRFREVTVYNSVVAKITHLVVYVRADEVTIEKRREMGSKWKDPFPTAGP